MPSKKTPKNTEKYQNVNLAVEFCFSIRFFLSKFMFFRQTIFKLNYHAGELLIEQAVALQVIDGRLAHERHGPLRFQNKSWGDPGNLLLFAA